MFRVRLSGPAPSYVRSSKEQSVGFRSRRLQVQSLPGMPNNQPHPRFRNRRMERAQQGDHHGTYLGT